MDMPKHLNAGIAGYNLGKDYQAYQEDQAFKKDMENMAAVGEFNTGVNGLLQKYNAASPAGDTLSSFDPAQALSSAPAPNMDQFNAEYENLAKSIAVKHPEFVSFIKNNPPPNRFDPAGLKEWVNNSNGEMLKVLEMSAMKSGDPQKLEMVQSLVNMHTTGKITPKDIAVLANAGIDISSIPGAEGLRMRDKPYTLSSGASRWLGDKKIAENPVAPDTATLSPGQIRVSGGKKIAENPVAPPSTIEGWLTNQLGSGKMTLDQVIEAKTKLKEKVGNSPNIKVVTVPSGDPDKPDKVMAIDGKTGELKAQWGGSNWSTISELEDQGAVSARFLADPQMKGNQLGEKTAKGWQVFDSTGKIIGYYR